MIYESLFDWQKKIVDEFKDRNSFGLFLKMGLGKTPLGIAFAEANNCTKAVVITINAKAIEGMKSGSWFDWASKSSMNYELCDKHFATFNSNSQLLLINFESLFVRTKDKKMKCQLKDNILRFIESCKDHNVAIIVDESHKVKNLQSQQTSAIMQIQRRLKTKAKSVYTYLLTGTPFTTGYIDLWTQLKLLGCEMTKGQFIDTFCERGNVAGLLGWQQPIVGYKNVKELFELVHKYALTVECEEVLDLPDKIFINHIIPQSLDFELFVQEKAHNNKIVDYIVRNELSYSSFLDFDIKFDDYKSTTRKVNPFYRNIAYPDLDWLSETSGQFWLRARQLAIGFQGNAEKSRWFDRRRLDNLRDFLERNEDNYVLFYNFTPELLELYTICEELGYNIDIYCGEIKSLIYYDRYSEQTDAQRLTNKKNIILANFASGSTGMNWQNYSNCIIFSIPLFKDYEQGIKRVHRYGQTHTVFYHVFYQQCWLDLSMRKSLETCQNYDKKLFEDDLRRVQDVLR